MAKNTAKGKVQAAGWSHYSELILAELEANRDFRKEVRDSLTSIKVDIGGLKVKAAVAGGAAGIIGTGIVSLVLSAFK